MNKYHYISKLCLLCFLVLFIVFSCNNENKGEKDAVFVPDKLKIDSVNAAEFAHSFVQDIYHSDTMNARSKIQIKYESDSTCVSDLLAIKELCNNFDIFSVLHQAILVGGDLDFQFYQVQEQNNIIWLRLFTAPLEVNYYRVLLSVIDDSIVISDFTSFYSPNSCDAMMTELVALVHEKRQLSYKDMREGFRFIDSSINAFSSLNPSLADLYYSKIDIALRETAIMKSAKYNVDFHSSAEVRINAILEKTYEIGKEGSTEWYWLRQYYLNLDLKSYGEARGAIDRLGNTIGADPILTYLKGVTYFEEYNYSRALVLYNEALIMEPKIPNIHFAKVVCLIEMKEFIQAVESLLVMEDYFDVKNTNWDKEFMAYPAFLISDEYFQWLERAGVIEDEKLL